MDSLRNVKYSHRYILPLRMGNVAGTSIRIPLMVEVKTCSRPNMTFRGDCNTGAVDINKSCHLI